MKQQWRVWMTVIVLLTSIQGLGSMAFGQAQTGTATSSQTASPPGNQGATAGTTTTGASTTKPGATPPTPPPAPDKPDIFTKSAEALGMLFVLALLLENALAVLFNWRLFLTYFSRRGVKTIFMIAGAALIVWSFDLDIVHSVVQTYQQAMGSSVIEPKFVTKLLTALILAGGSAGVYNIMVALGIRNERKEAELDATPPPNKAWVAVKVLNAKTLSDVLVEIDGPLTAPNALPAAIAGTVRLRPPSIREVLLRNFDRFPANGGYTLEPNKAYRICVKGMSQNNSVKALDQVYVFAPGAIVDFEVTLT